MDHVFSTDLRWHIYHILNSHISMGPFWYSILIHWSVSLFSAQCWFLISMALWCVLKIDRWVFFLYFLLPFPTPLPFQVIPIHVFSQLAFRIISSSPPFSNSLQNKNKQKNLGAREAAFMFYWQSIYCKCFPAKIIL